MNFDSGKKRGYRKTKGGGKVKKVVLTACMGKFLTILNAMMRDRVPFRQTVLP